MPRLEEKKCTLKLLSQSKIAGLVRLHGPTNQKIGFKAHMSPNSARESLRTGRLNVFMLKPSLPVGEDWVRAGGVDSTVDVTPIEYNELETEDGSGVDGDSIVSIKTPKLRPARFFWRANTELAARRLSRFIDSRPLQGPHRLAHGHFYSGSYALRRLQERKKIPYVVTEHSSALTGSNPAKPDSPNRLRRAAWVYENASAVLPVSHSLAQEMTARGLPTPNLQVVYNPVDTELFKPGAGAQRPRVVTVARLEPVKRVDALIRSMPNLLRAVPDVSLHIAGTGSEKLRLRQLVNDLNVDRSVTFHGHLTRPEVAKLLRSCSVFALASHTENMPVAALEAAASGLPIVAPGVGGIPELLEIVAGELYEPWNERGLVNCLTRGLESSDRVRQQTRDAAVRSFSLDAIGAQLAGIYRNVALTEDP